MKHTLRICTGLLLPLVMMISAHDVWALGLGNASVDSYLNQPLQARIALITRADEDLSAVTAGLASAEDFALIGASLDAISVPLRFSVKQEGGSAEILVTSSLPVRDPVIRLIVEVNWAKGRMLREYTLFLDPPVFNAPAPSPAIGEQATRKPQSHAATSPVAGSESQDESREETAGEVDDKAADGASTESGASDIAEGGAGEYGPVQGGETLWRIASSWSQGTGLSINAAMLAIQRNNPQAFINNNVNLLKQGAVLRLPEFSEAAQISAAEARNEIVLQSQTVSRREPESAPQSASEPAVETPLVDEMSEESSAAPDAAGEDQGDQLELVPPAKATDVDSTYGVEESVNEAGASTSVLSLREELARKEEELIAQQQENLDLKERLKEMEASLASGQEGTVANEGMAQMEAKLREDRLSQGGFESPADTPSAAENPQAAAASPPQSATTQASGAQKPKSWFSGITAWIVGLLAVGAIVAGWLFSTRGKQTAIVPDPVIGKIQTVRGIKDEAEKILEALGPESSPGLEHGGPTHSGAAQADSQPRAQTARIQDEAEFLDEDSADPEVRLDLARAYIAMGDREAARVILAEVIEHGSEQQKAESQAMLAAL